ncbi:hypothetical protein AGMMS49525_04920 [Bacteroidia bacterium]|nr:hypothetical protein AGMMS49525_04920 [Bacteroidia bacterium]
MKAITVKQPWANIICSGIKDVENRTWKTNYRGRVLIHASAKPSVILFDLVKSGFFSDEQRHNIVMDDTKNAMSYDELITGAIIGSIEIVDCVKNHPSIWAEDGVWNWVLANPILFKEPIKNVKGKLSFWESGINECSKCGKPTNLTCVVCDECFRVIWDEFFCE